MVLYDAIPSTAAAIMLKWHKSLYH